jgi:hypothetical protein
MLDVVFIMLIFFIVTATFIKESGIDVDKPEAATAVVQEKASILIAIDARRPRSGSTAARSTCAPCAPSSSACTRRTPRARW